jgi:hypothetical protein
VKQITKLAESARRLDGKCTATATSFSKDALLPCLVKELEALGTQGARREEQSPKSEARGAERA